MMLHYRIVKNNIRITSFKLFNLITDPTENLDVAAKYPNIAKNLQRDIVKKYQGIQTLDKRGDNQKVTHTEEQLKKLKALGYIN